MVDLVRVSLPVLAIAPPLPPTPPLPALPTVPALLLAKVLEPIVAVPPLKIAPPFPSPPVPGSPVFDANLVAVTWRTAELQMPPPFPALGNGASPSGPE